MTINYETAFTIYLCADFPTTTADGNSINIATAHSIYFDGFDFVKHSTTAIETNVSLTRIELKDPTYPFFVTLYIKTYASEDVIEQGRK